MSTKKRVLAFELSELETVLEVCKYERERYPQNAARVFAILDAIVGLNWKTVDSETRAMWHSRLNRLLARYEWRVTVSPSADKGSRPVYQPSFGSSKRAGEQWERRIVAGLLADLQGPNMTARLARCETCQDFVVGKKVTRRRFCSRQACKQKAYESQPEKKARKLLKMRENYQAQKRRDADLRAKASQARKISKGSVR